MFGYVIIDTKGRIAVRSLLVYHTAEQALWTGERHRNKNKYMCAMGYTVQAWSTN